MLFVVALGVYGLESVAWPLSAGRDLRTYLLFYEQMWGWHALLPAVQLIRTPVAPLVTGVTLDLGGGWLAMVVMAVLYAGSIVAWATVALVFGRRAALLTALALLVYPSYGALFHELSSDAVYAAGFALWALLLVRAAGAPSAGRFALLGLGTALIALTGPGNQLLVVFALLPLFLRAAWRQRLVWVGACLLPAVVCLGGWAGLNDLRYSDFTVAGNASELPFYRGFVVDRIISPGNGPASRQLAQAVERYLLPSQPYRSYGIDLKRFFSSGSTRMSVDLISLSDRIWGWHSNILERVSIEAIQTHLGRYLRGVATTVWDLLRFPVYGPRATNSSTATPLRRATIVVNGHRVPKPTEGEPIPDSHQSNRLSTPDNRIRVTWTSPNRNHIVFRNPHDQHRYRTLVATVNRVSRTLPTYAANPTLLLRLNQVSHRYPWPVIWLGAGLLGVIIRRPRNASIALAIAAAALLVIISTALGLPAVAEYAAPVAPALILLGAVGTLGQRPARS
jgi:hypothetical protein